MHLHEEYADDDTYLRWVNSNLLLLHSIELLVTITATAHKLARIIYAMLRYGQQYVDAGAEHYERQHHQRALRATTRRAALLGYELVPISGAGDTRLPNSATA